MVGVGLGGETRERDLHEIGIAKVSRAIGVGELLRFRHLVQRGGGIEALLGQGEAFEDVEDFDDVRAPGRGRRHRDDGIAAIGSAHRLALDRAIFGEVGHCHPPARRLDRGDDLLRHRSAVEARRAIRGDRLKRRREVVERDVIAGPFHASVGPEKHAGRRRMAGERFGRQGERISDVVVDGETLVSERDRRSDELGERELAGAVFAPGELKAGDRPRHADREAGKA